LVRYGDETRVEVLTHTRQPAGDEVVIGRPEHGIFLAVPGPAVDLLIALAEGGTCGEARARYVARHGHDPDLEDFLSILESKGFVRPAASFRAGEETLDPHGGDAEAGRPKTHLKNFPPGLARFLFRPAMLTIYGAVIATGALLMSRCPACLPRRDVFVFTRHMTTLSLLLLAIALTSTLLHELAHLVAARAAGVPASLSFGHRLWIVVAETDLSRLWAVPKRRRYLPILAGVLIDAVSAALLTGGLYLAAARGLAEAPAFRFLQAVLMVYLLRILWQACLFVRTDFYFVLTTWFDCKDLMRDTERFLKNLTHRFLGWGERVDQSHIPPRERRVIHAFSGLWIGGRLVAVAILLKIQLPTGWLYAKEIARVWGARDSLTPYAVADRISLAALALAPLGLGLFLWARTAWRSRTEAS
jgi:putative peptide zinc metalloprotease protein